MESTSEGGRSWFLKSLEGGVSSPYPNTIEGHKVNSVTLSHLEYYYPNYSRDSRFNWDEQLLIQQDTALLRDPGGSNGGCKESVKETG
jgi:hypothetical protein